MNQSNSLYLIGETAFHHEGDKLFLKKLTEGIKRGKCDAIKFHLTLSPEQYFQKKHPLVEKINDWIFNKEEWTEIITDAQDKNLDVIALCNEIDSAIFINDAFPKIKGVEIHATGINDFHLLNECAKFQGTLYIGIGGCSINEIQVALDFLKERGKTDIVLMYGFQSYPTNYAEINLSKMKKIKDLFGLPVGYADHTGFDDKHNSFVSVMGVSMGVSSIIEKHFTTNVGEERIDYHAAVGEDTLLEIRKLAELTLNVTGAGDLGMSEKEKAYGNVGPMKKALVAARGLKKGETLHASDLSFKRTEAESNMSQEDFLKIVGLTLINDIEEDEMISLSDFEYKFKQVSAASFTKIGGTDK